MSEDLHQHGYNKNITKYQRETCQCHVNPSIHPEHVHIWILLHITKPVDFLLEIT